MAIAFDNATPGNLENLCKNCDCTGFAPAADYDFDAAVPEIGLLGTSVFTAGDAFKNMNVEVIDAAGNSVKGGSAVAPGTVALNLSTLDLTKPFSVKVTISSTGGCVSDGSVIIAAAGTGTLGNWDKEFTSSEAANIAAPPALS